MGKRGGISPKQLAKQIHQSYYISVMTELLNKKNEILPISVGVGKKEIIPNKLSFSHPVKELIFLHNKIT
jgi:hypothetical protein